MTWIFDIETIPDTALLTQKFGFSGSFLDICNAAFDEQKNRTGSEFLPLPFHRVVAISCVVADEFGRFVKVGNFGAKAKEKLLASLDSLDSGDSLDSQMLDSQKAHFQNLNSEFDKFECELLQDFWTHFNKTQPKLVSFNGRAFDMGVLTLRAMRYNICAHAFFDENDPARNKNKWENYRARYSAKFHIDLLEILGNFGAARGLNLDSLCLMCGITGKYDMDGSQVYETIFGALDSQNVDSGKQDCEKRDCENFKTALEKVENYCQSDVLNTYWLWLKFCVLDGSLMVSDYAELLQTLLENLPNVEYKNAFAQKIEKELQGL